MSVPSVMYPHGIILPSGGPLVQFSDVQPANNYKDLVEFAAGMPSPGFAGSDLAVPDITFTSKQIATILAACTTEGLVADFSGGNVDLLYRKALARGTRVPDATTSHERARLTSNSMLYWTGIRAQQSGTAELMGRFLPIWDGQNNPMIWTGSVGLSGTSTVSDVFTLGPISLNGSQVLAVQDADWENNVVPEEVAGDGEEFITYGAVDTYSPTLTFRTRQTSVIRTFGAKGTALSALVFYLRRRLAGGINVPDATATHVKIVATAGVIKARDVKGMKGLAEVFVQMTRPVTSDQTATPFTVTAASAIT